MQVFAILPEGSVRDETTFFVMLTILAALVGVALFLRARRKKKEELEGDTSR